MKNTFRTTLFIALSLVLLLGTSCSKPPSAAETEEQTSYYEEKYADEPAPSEEVQRVLDFLETCVGGQYIYGAQGDRITSGFVSRVYKMYESYFTQGRYDYFMDIANESSQKGHSFPEDYAWDCSGLWWYTATELGLYEDIFDLTASDTYKLCCTPITKDELRPGDLVFIEDEEGKIVHMGIVGVHGYIYEAASGFVGVVKKRTVDIRIYENIVNGGVVEYNSWNLFGRPTIFE